MDAERHLIRYLGKWQADRQTDREREWKMTVDSSNLQMLILTGRRQLRSVLCRQSSYDHFPLHCCLTIDKQQTNMEYLPTLAVRLHSAAGSPNNPEEWRYTRQMGSDGQKLIRKLTIDEYKRISLIKMKTKTKLYGKTKRK